MQITSFRRVTNNLAKIGFFPTTEEDTTCIASYITTSGQTTFLDPCCGDGTALDIITNEIRWNTDILGIEIEETRAKKAKEKIPAVINEDFFNLQIEKNSIGAIFLNPPYFKDENLHQLFIEKATNILTTKGLLILIIPEYELSGKTANYITSYYEKISIYKANDTSFKQIILFGIKKEKPEITDGSHLYHKAKQAKTITQKNRYDNPYEIPKTKELKNIKILSRDIDPDYLESILNNFTEDWNSIIRLIPESLSIKKPLLPLRKGHLAQVLASGLIDGVIEQGEKKFLIKGTTTRTEEVIEENEEETITVTKDIITILLMDAEGNIKQIK